MPSHGFRLATALAMLGLMVAPARAQFCFLDHAVQEGRGIELHFVPGSGVFVRIPQEGQGVAATDRM